MNNKDKYREALDQIHAREELKQETIDKINKKHKKSFLKIINCGLGLATVTACAALGVVVFNKNLTGIFLKDNSKKEILPQNDKIQATSKLEEYGVRRFANLDELKEVLDENTNKYVYNMTEKLDVSLAENSIATDNTLSGSRGEETKTSSTNYSKTNNQVENVDEADIIKTDGEYIYYTQNSKVYIVDSKTLEIKSEIYKEENDNFSPTEIFINGDKLIVLGNTYTQRDFSPYCKYDILETNEIRNFQNEINIEDHCIDILPSTNATVRVYDITDVTSPKKIREVSLDGYYTNSRMIEDNIYFISNCYIGWDENIKNATESEIVPKYMDSNISEEEQVVHATDIAFFENSDDYSYMLIGGFNLNDEKEVNVETFFGAGGNIYASENNLYLVKSNYEIEDGFSVNTSDIFKFKLSGGTITAVASGKVPGYVNNQFSIDEYDGNLRIATTIYKEEKVQEENSEYMTVTRVIGSDDSNYTNQITIFDESLNQIGVIENIEDGEKIYAVRFMQNVRVCSNI